jgi:hypothetical protein
MRHGVLPQIMDNGGYAFPSPPAVADDVRRTPPRDNRGTHRK